MLMVDKNIHEVQGIQARKYLCAQQDYMLLVASMLTAGCSILADMLVWSLQCFCFLLLQ